MINRTRTVSEETLRRAELSRQEAKEFIERELKCPMCGFLIGTAFSDSRGHIKMKCQKCKTISVLNFAYFCRQKRKYRYNSQ